MTDQLATLLSEQRRFPPEPGFSAQANAQPGLHQSAAADRLGFWEEQARQLEWVTPWREVLEWTPPHARWFVGGQLNVSANCLDRHLAGPRRNKAAIIWEGEPGDRRVLTYWDLAREVNRAANALKSLGVTRGDRVAIYLPMIPEAAIAMLACTRIGAVHSVVFGGFSAESLRDRINDAQARLLITADGGYRRGAMLPLKRIADEAIAGCPSIEDVVVVRRGGGGDGDESHTRMEEGRDHWWHRLLAGAAAKCDPEPMDAEDLLFILYTSGTTGKPKGIVHTTGGYLTQAAATTRLVFDLKENDVFWCTADIGWVTGHSYVVYGPLANGATVVMYEGAPDWPERDRFWEIVARYGVTVFYTAPTAIRAFMKWGSQHPDRHAAPPGHGGRADQPRSLDLVSPPHRRGALPDRGHLVADGNRRDHDHPAPRHHHYQARQRHRPLPRHLGRTGRCQGGADRAGRWLPDPDRAVAGNAPDDLWR
jgi:acetyl-CoA synthetase